jgi:hypothetical protein
MCKNILGIVLLTFIHLNADVFENNCMSCHTNNTQLKMIISRYTLKFSSEEKIKEAIFNYLRNPSKELSSMPLGFLSRFEIKEKSQLSDQELKKAINIYYEKYNLLQLLK